MPLKSSRREKGRGRGSRRKRTMGAEAEDGETTDGRERSEGGARNEKEREKEIRNRARARGSKRGHGGEEAGEEAEETDEEEMKKEDLCKPKTHQRRCSRPVLQVPSSYVPTRICCYWGKCPVGGQASEDQELCQHAVPMIPTTRINDIDAS
jgi:hypothetical protein